ncbi:MAG: hypothetical protein V1716_00525 [Candidatus Uhrbacteria bacterium]
MQSTLLAVNPGLAAGEATLDTIGTTTQLDTMPLPDLIGSIINVLLGALGIVFVGLVIYAGILYFTDAGGEKSAKKAKEILKTAIIGLVIIIAAYAISNYVMGALVAATTVG